MKPNTFVSTRNTIGDAAVQTPPLTASRTTKLCFTCILALTICAPVRAQEVELLLAGKKVKLRPLKNEAAVATEGADTAIISELRNQGIVSWDTVRIGKQTDSTGYTLYKFVKKKEKKKFYETVRRFNSNNVNEAEITPVYEYENSLNILTKEFIIAFREDVPADTLAKFLIAHGMEKISDDSLLHNQYIIQFKKLTPVQALEKLSKFNATLVRYIEPNFIQIFKNSPYVPSVTDKNESFQRHFISSPNDRLLYRQWYLRNENQLADISMIGAWSISKGSPNITIAILDEGVDTTHPDLVDKIVHPYDAVENDANQEPQARAGHGTACAGIAAASTDNVEGIAGIAWNCRIMPVRIAEVDPENRWVTNPKIIARGIIRAVNKGARVLSCSWSGGPPSGLLADAIDYATFRNCVMVFAAGNDNHGVNYPAKWSLEKPIIAVAATNQWDESKSPSSRDGERWGTNFGAEITVSAPGVSICTTDISGHGRGYDRYSSYFNFFSGTSASTPMVAAAIALMLSKNPSLTLSEVLQLLKQNCDVKGTAFPDPRFGYGRLNIAKLLNAVPELNTNN